LRYSIDLPFALFGKAPTLNFLSALLIYGQKVFEELNHEGIYCSLATGQEKKDVPFADHLSCTIEMVNVNK
jgi:ATP-dependent RNA helicase SUPV3L1/SUV3